MRIDKPTSKRKRVAHAPGRFGFSLIEVVISTFLVGMVIIGAMRALGSSMRANERTHRQGRAVMFADALMSEIQRQAYIDDSTPVFGRETDETATDRSQHDDVDDYDDWDSSPLTNRDGTSMTDLSWSRKVEVEHLNPVDLQVVPDANDQHLKRITVTVYQDDVQLAQLQAIRTAATIEQTEGSP